MTMINFREHSIRKIGKYKCECGCKFQRVETTYWTENPFNNLWKQRKIKELNTKCENKLKEWLKEKKCPKCGIKCKIIKK